jgi:hypothetical protein
VYKKRGRTDLNTDAWGLAYMTTEWLAANIAPSWSLLVFDPARYGHLQDVYVLQKREVNRGAVEPALALGVLT